MHIRKARAGSVPGHTWTRDAEVLEVDDYLAEQLLLIPNGGFSIAEAPEPAPEPVQEFDETFERGEPVDIMDEPEEPEAEEPKKGPGRPKSPRDAKGNIIR